MILPPCMEIAAQAGEDSNVVSKMGSEHNDHTIQVTISGRQAPEIELDGQHSQQKPSTILPISPMNVEAGLKL